MSSRDVPQPVADIQKRAAKVNTQLRFKNHEEALNEAYDLRLHIQTCGFDHPLVEEELKVLQLVIKTLERRRFGYHRYLATLFLKALYDAFRVSADSEGAPDDDPILLAVPPPSSAPPPQPEEEETEDLPPGAPRI